VNKLIQNQQHLAEWVRKQTGTLDMAVAFWGAGSIEELGLDKRKKPFRVLLDLSAGATNPWVVKTLLDLQPKGVRHVHRLHAKAYIGEKEVVIGSANASANGLGLEGTEATRWTELGMLTNDKKMMKDTADWFEFLWDSAKKPTPAKIEKAKATWMNNQKKRPRDSAKGKGILEAAIANPARFKNIGFWVVISTGDMTQPAQDDYDELKETKNIAVDCWEGWDDIPLDSHLICFCRYAKTFTNDEVPVVYSGPKLRTYKRLTLVEPSPLEDLVTGEVFTVEGVNKWRPALKRYKASMTDDQWDFEDGLCIDLGEFAERFGND
jgi:hypothetical protein